MGRGKGMSKRRYKQGLDRRQGMLLPERVEDYVTEENAVRAIDTYVDSLDLGELGFRNASGGLTPGQPAFSPKVLLKLFIYGFLHGVRSSRKLARECQRNLEVIWLMEGLQPGYKTIADFRKDNLEAIKATNRDFVELCQELDLFGNELVAIDGSFFRGNVSKKSIYTEKRLQKSLMRLEKQIETYLREMEQVDTAEEHEEEEESARLDEKLEKLKVRQKKNQERLTRLQENGAKQLAEVDEDARLLSKNGQSLAGYNVQTAVDEKHKLIVSCEVTQDGNDTQQLAPMAKKAQNILGTVNLEVAADAGYYNSALIKECLDANLTPYVPKPERQVQARCQGRFTRTDFHYNAELDAYICPAEQVLAHSSQSLKNGLLRHSYRSKRAICADCPFKAQCLPTKSRFRNLYRWEHEDIIEAHMQRMAEQGSIFMEKRACIVEHPFGTLKSWLGWHHFLLRSLPKVRAEMEFSMLCYNFKRVLSILGVEKFREYCQKRNQRHANLFRFPSSFSLCEAIRVANKTFLTASWSFIFSRA
jgi:transposase